MFLVCEIINRLLFFYISEYCSPAAVPHPSSATRAWLPHLHTRCRIYLASSLVVQQRFSGNHLKKEQERIERPSYAEVTHSHRQTFKSPKLIPHSHQRLNIF